jgi:hypothetical protein
VLLLLLLLRMPPPAAVLLVAELRLPAAEVLPLLALQQTLLLLAPALRQPILLMGLAAGRSSSRAHGDHVQQQQETQRQHQAGLLVAV